MKKALIILLALTMVMSMFAIVPFGASAAEGEMTLGAVAADYTPEGTPVTSAEDFANMAADGKYYLAADITVDATYADNFTGTFDGNGKTVTTSVPLFEQFNGTAKNLTILGAIVYSEATTAFKTEGYAGALANIAGDKANTYIINVVNKANLTVYVGGYCGGLVGLLGGDEDNDDNVYLVENCVNYGEIVWEAATDGLFASVGGIVGYINYGKTATFNNCVNNVDIAPVPDADFKVQLGGIVGGGDDSVTFEEVVFEDCINRGDLTLEKGWSGYELTGGILSHSYFTKMVTFADCLNEGDLIGSCKDGNAMSGGMLGRTTKNIQFTNCINTGDITNTFVGGIVGSAEGPGDKDRTLVGCGNTGKISTTGVAGGLAGRLYGDEDVSLVISGCFNTGEIYHNREKYSQGYASGLVGYTTTTTDVTIEYCYVAGKIHAPDVAEDAREHKGDFDYAADYKFTDDKTGVTYYFSLPYKASKVEITGNKVVPTYKGSGIDVEIGDTVAKGKYLRFYSPYTHKWLSIKTTVAGTLEIDENDNVTVSGTPQITECVDVLVYTQPTYVISAFINVKEGTVLGDLNIENNMVSDTLSIADYYCGKSKAGDYKMFPVEVESTGTFTAAQLASGELAYTLNDLAGETFYYQNLDPELFEVDAYPTTDKTHAKVVPVIGGTGYTNELFVEDASGSPATGDATVYVVVSLAVSTIALAAVAVVRKQKEN